ncbi:Ser/Thr protein phosphatase, putative [Trichomonas vaginalis G3]|uniref:Serine/threonine-protein phosphatase n=1 Tax=Trichomonas vaginalis (strain ATCC PRA-98 / G3) TaxID=412133 RepID=A2EMD8_TRIV3|nr:phosphoprotein phosphatase protein [Trichomonas vaginalis G3]EAY06176.1 Ser/Thr protein phosphatase, putative [Trichomonas vaginalis G3]KAI5544325.1 phosphoprotein phosphatase protein [Trichomonas vaginalis G3]|eukprot:XP_001318399.1 Ser/Thr protein phosphatase [Trichomonas vaginalis G3]
MKTENKARFRVILENFLPYINASYDEPIRRGRSLKLPFVMPELLRDLLTEVKEIFQNEPNILTVPDNTVIVGDLHGHIFDLFRILHNFKLPPLKNYLFLGDYVDRGEFSTETVILLFTLKVLYPKNVYMIRGNHEFFEIFSDLDFYNELLMVYAQDDIVQLFNQAFSFLPLAAIIDKFALGIHGGLGYSFTSLSQIESIQRPIDEFDDGVLSDLLWSDPAPNELGFNPSPRGMGSLFGTDVTKKFLENSPVEIIIRGHQCIDNGVEKCDGHQLYTVFSASRYCNQLRNQSGVLIIRQRQFEAHTYPPLQYIYREEVKFIPTTITKSASELPSFQTRTTCSMKLTRAETQSTPRLNLLLSEAEEKLEPRPLTPRKRSMQRDSITKRLFENSCHKIGIKYQNSFTTDRLPFEIKEPDKAVPPSPRRNRNRC